MSELMGEVLDIVYDGECPFCSRYATMVQLRENGVVVRLHDARDEATYRALPEAEGYDLDEGMLARWQGQWFYGAQAMREISRLSRTAPLAALMQDPRLSAVFYPVLRGIRNLTLRV